MSSSLPRKKFMSSFAHKFKELVLPQQHKYSARRRDEAFEERYQKIFHVLETPHIDNMEILKTLIYAKDDQLPLFDSSTKKRVSIETLRRKIVLLLISDLDVTQEELPILDRMYREAKQNPTRRPAESQQLEVVWLPIIDRSLPWTKAKQKQFETLQNLMPWLSVHHPSLLDPAVIKYIKDHWHFAKKPIVVVLDQQGKVVNLNALHMISIWGSSAFPFTSSREEALWKDESWRIELLVDSVEPMIFSWIAEGKYICLYGGEDLDWIRKFTTTAKAVARDANIELEMLYVGKSNPKDKVRENYATILVENLSHVLSDMTLIWFFWERLESMRHSKAQHGNSVENDRIIQEIMTILSFDGSDQGWAIISKLGAVEMAKGKGEIMLTSMVQFNDRWSHHVEEKGFLPALIDHLRELHTPHPPNHLIFPATTTGSIPDSVVCAECGRPMEKFIMYRCCPE